MSVWAHSVALCPTEVIEADCLSTEDDDATLSIVMFKNNALSPLRDICGYRRYTYVTRVTEGHLCLQALLVNALGKKAGPGQALSPIGHADSHAEHLRKASKGP